MNEFVSKSAKRNTPGSPHQVISKPGANRTKLSLRTLRRFAGFAFQRVDPDKKARASAGLKSSIWCFFGLPSLRRGVESVIP